METEKGVMIVAYKRKNAPRYLVLKREDDWEGWETPKGRLEDNDYEETVRIELREEAGIDPGQIVSIEEMDDEVSWEYKEDGEEFRKEYRTYLVEVEEDAHVDTSSNPDEEHEHGFFFSFRDAVELVTYDNNRELIEKAEQRLTQE